MIALTENEVRFGRQCHPTSMAPPLRNVISYQETDLGTSEMSAAHALLSLTPSALKTVSVPPSSHYHQSAFQPPVSTLRRSIMNKPHHHHPSTSTFKPLEIVSCASDFASSSSSSSDSSFDGTTQDSEYSNEANSTFFNGSTSLTLDSDEDFLSPLHTFMRRYCVEAFSASAADAMEPRFGGTHNGRVIPGQVGIRCMYCKHRPAGQRRERAVCFPSSLKNIYHSIETWQRRHSIVCQDIPLWVKRSMAELIERSKSGAGGRRQYWEESARRLGLADTSNGIRFIRPPGDVGETRDDASLSTVDPEESRFPVVAPEDSELVTEYLFMLLDQMETCRFTEEDRAGGRSKVKDCPVGFPGMQCKHCCGKAGFGRYFPTTLAALTSANSDRNIFNHIKKCRRCPRPLQERLIQLQKEHQQLKNRRGSRKLFFEKVWNRLHP